MQSDSTQPSLHFPSIEMNGISYVVGARIEARYKKHYQSVTDGLRSKSSR